MSTRISSLIVKLTGDTSGLVNPVRQLSKELNDAGRRASSFFAGFNALGGNLKNVGAGLTAGITLPLGGLAVAALKVSGDVERAEKSFTRFAGSVDGARRFIRDLQAVADKSDLTFDEIREGARKITTFSKDTADATNTVRILTDTIAGVAGTSENFESVSRALQQISAKGKLSAEELNQIGEAGVNVGKGLAEQFGITQAQLLKLTERGLIPADAAIRGILRALDKEFGGAAAKQADSLLGIWSTVRDQASRTAQVIGDVLAPTAKRILVDFVQPTLSGIKDLAKGFSELSPSTQSAILGIAALAAAAGPLTFGLGQLIQSTTSIIALFQTMRTVSLATIASIGATTLAVGGLAAALVYLAINWKAANDAERDALEASRLADDATRRTRRAIQERGGDVSRLDIELRKGQITLAQYEKGLRDMLVSLTNQQGPLRKNAAVSKTATDGYSAMAAGIKKLLDSGTELQGEEKLPEYLTRISDNAIAAAGALAKLNGASSTLTNFVLEEVASRNAQAFQTMKDKLVDFLQAGELFGNKLKLDTTFEELAAAAIESHVALQVMNNQLARTGPVSAAALLGVDKLKTRLEDFGLRTTQSVRQEIAELQRVIDDLFAKRSQAPGNQQADINNDINEAIRKRRELEVQVGDASADSSRRAATGLIEVSTITTNLSQALSNLIFDGGKLGETMIKVGKQIGESLTANLIQKLITSSGLIDKMGKGLGRLAKNIPGLGSIFGGGASVASNAAGSVASAGSSVGGSAASALVSSGLASTISAVTGVVSAVTGVIGLFQGATTNKRLGQLTSTAQGQLNQAVSQQETFNLYLPSLPQIHDRLKQIISNGLGVFSQAQSVVRSYIVGSSGDVFGAGALELISEKLNPLPEMLDRLNQVVSVGVPVYNADFQPALRVEGGSGLSGLSVGFDRSVIAGGPYAEATLDWLADELSKRIQARGGGK